MLIGNTLGDIRQYIRRGPQIFAPVWTPFELGSDLLSWWNTDRADLIALTGNLVDSFADCVFGNALIASGAARPLYSTNSFAGSPAITFVPADLTTLANVSSFGFPVGSDGSEIWAVLSQDALVADATIRTAFVYGTINANTNRAVRRLTGSGTNQANVRIGDGGATAVASSTAVNFQGRHFVRAQFSPTISSISIDDTPPVTVAVVPATGSGVTRMGAQAAGSGIFDGKIRDVIVTRPLSPANATLLSTWCAARANP